MPREWFFSFAAHSDPGNPADRRHARQPLREVRFSCNHADSHSCIACARPWPSPARGGDSEPSTVRADDICTPEYLMRTCTHAKGAGAGWPTADEEREQTRSCAQDPRGPGQSHWIGSDYAGGLERSDAAGAERMDLLGHLGEAGNDAQPPDRTRSRGTPGGQTPPVLLARLSASPTERKEVV